MSPLKNEMIVIVDVQPGIDIPAIDVYEFIFKKTEISINERERKKENIPKFVINLIGNEDDEKKVSFASLILLEKVHREFLAVLFGLTNGKK